MIRVFMLFCSCIAAVAAATLDLDNSNLPYVAGGSAIALDGNATLSGADFSSGSLGITMTITNGLVVGEDLVQIRASGTVTVSSGVVSVSGVAVGPYSIGSNGSPLSITITPGTSMTTVETLVRALAYQNLAGSGATAGDRIIQITIADKNGSFSDQRTVAVGPGNAAPALTIGGALVVPRTARFLIGPSVLMAVDTEDAAYQLTYQLGSLPEHGDLLLTNTDGAGDLTTTVVLGLTLTEFTQADIDAGRLRYDHRGGPATSDSFTLRVRDTEGAATPLTAVGIVITGTTTNPVITLPSGALTCTEQGGAVAMDPAAPVSLGVSVSDADSRHYRGGSLVVSLVDAVGASATTAGDAISVRAANGLTPSPTQAGYICVSGSSIYIRHTASSDPLPTFGGNDASDQLLGTIDSTDNGTGGHPLRITFASTVVRTVVNHPVPGGDAITAETEVVTPQAVAQLIANLQLAHPGDNPPTTPRFMKVTISENNPNTGSGSAQRPITVIPVNDVPAFTVAGPVNLTAVAGRTFIASFPASDPDLPSGASLTYRLATPVSGVSLDTLTGAIRWTPPDTTPVALDLIAQDDQGADSSALHVVISPQGGVTADPPYVISDPLVELGEGELIFHPFTIAPPAAGAVSVSVQIIGDAPLGIDADPVSMDGLSWTLTAPPVAKPADGVYTFGLRIQVDTGSSIEVGYQPITLVVVSVSGSN